MNHSHSPFKPFTTSLPPPLHCLACLFLILGFNQSRKREGNPRLLELGEEKNYPRIETGTQ